MVNNLSHTAGAQPLNYLHFTDERIAQVQAGSGLTVEERQFLLLDTRGFEECDAQAATTLANLTDPELMQFAYQVWADYASTQA
jgi:hypothetical protein